MKLSRFQRFMVAMGDIAGLRLVEASAVVHTQDEYRSVVKDLWETARIVGAWDAMPKRDSHGRYLPKHPKNQPELNLKAS